MRGMFLGLLAFVGGNVWAQTTPIVSNGGFEARQINSSYETVSAGGALGGGWFVESGAVEVIHMYWASADFMQSIDLNGGPGQAGTIYQDIATIPGLNYRLGFSLAGNPDGTQPIKRVKVFWDGREVGDLTFDATGRTKQNMGWAAHTIDVTASGATTRLKFQSMTADAAGPALDAVWMAELPTEGVILNGGFEQIQIGPGYFAFSAGNQVGGGWFVESGSVELVHDYWPAAEGHQSIDLNGIADQVGTLYQDIPTVAGKAYRVRFAFAGNPEDAGADKRMKVFWNDGEVADLTFNTAGRSLTDMGWRYHSYTVRAMGELSRLKFQSLTTGTFLGPVIDDVSIQEFRAASLGFEIAGQGATIKVAGNAGDAYRVESTAEFPANEWRELQRVTIPAGGEISVADESPRGERRFYRAVFVP